MAIKNNNPMQNKYAAIYLQYKYIHLIKCYMKKIIETLSNKASKGKRTLRYKNFRQWFCRRINIAWLKKEWRLSEYCCLLTNIPLVHCIQRKKELCRKLHSSWNYEQVKDFRWAMYVFVKQKTSTQIKQNKKFIKTKVNQLWLVSSVILD